MGLRERLAAVRDEIARCCRACGRDPDGVRLLPISKKHPAALVREAHALGERAFGENRVQELASKAAELDDLEDLEWHMVGSVQTNKVRQLLAVPHLGMVQSLDRVGLADELQSRLRGLGRSAPPPVSLPLPLPLPVPPPLPLPVLLQVNATGEGQKHGVEPMEAAALLRHLQRECPDLAVRGLMAMGPLAGDPSPCFQRVRELRERLRQSSGMALAELSMGMTGDLAAAIAAGSTMVRVGTGVFGLRPS